MKNEVKHTAHSSYRCESHIVFAPKYRRKIIYRELKRDIGEILRKLCNEMKVEIIEAEACPDHIHMLVSIPPYMSVAQFVGTLKSKSALMIFDRHANLKYRYGSRNFWCRGYYYHRRSIIDLYRRARIDPRLKSGYLKSVWNTFKGDGRMIRSGLILMIKDLAAKGKSAYAIGQEIGISKNTARKYMGQPARPHGLKGIRKGSKLDPYKPQLNVWMEQGIFNCVVLMERLRAQGYDGGMSILKEYVHPYRPARSAPAVRRYETPSGKQAQMDWGICQYLDQSGTLHKVAVFVMILGHSRAKYIEFVSRCDLHSMERCMLNAFQ